MVSQPRVTEELVVADKSPKQTNNKKVGKSLKEKRADKKAAAAGKGAITVAPGSKAPAGKSGH